MVPTMPDCYDPGAAIEQSAPHFGRLNRSLRAAERAAADKAAKDAAEAERIAEEKAEAERIAKEKAAAAKKKASSSKKGPPLGPAARSR